MSNPEAKYEVDPEEGIYLEKLRTPTPESDTSTPSQPKDRRSQAKYNIFSRIFFL
jgi:hypothetical protein